MKKTFRFFQVLLFVFIFTLNIFPQDYFPDIKSYYDAPNWIPQYDTGITCSGQPNAIIRDDGTYENGYRSVTSGDSTTFVQKMVMPPGGNITLSAICVAWTALAPSGNLGPYQLVVYDTLGAGGQPGNLIAVVNGVLANSIAVFPLHSRYRYPVNITGLTRRAYYIGVRWDNNPLLPFFISADENGPWGGPLYVRNTVSYPPVWSPCNTIFANCGNFGIRAEAMRAFSVCRNGLNLNILDFSIVRDSILVSLVGAGDITDVDVKIDTVFHTWDSDLTFYLSRNFPSPVGVKIINRVGGSGNNFIGTLLDDEASVPISSGTAPFTGSFRPFNPLTSFDGPYNVLDYWRLTITDTVAGDTGLLKAWCLIITYQIITGGIQTIEIPSSYRLYQNYPNPFNPATKIKFGLPENANVKLVVYDVLGREVAVLVNGFKQANTYEVDFDGAYLSSGVYFYKLDAGEFTAVRKMLLVK
jgi:hypothetical protein